MANPTTNFGWVMPTPTDLVTDLPADFEVFGQAVDTAFQYLKGGTTGQILSKTSNTDLAYTWITNDVGDITGVTAGTGLTGGGTSGAVTLTFDQANFGGGQNAAGKNLVLNSSINVWQRGTSIALAASSAITYTADRWAIKTGANQASVISRQVTGDTTNLPNIQYCARVQRNSGQTGTGNLQFTQGFENINSAALIGKTVTLSFYARAGANYSPASSILTAYVITGTGTDQQILSGFTGSATPVLSNATLTTTWQRFTYSGTIATTATQVGVGFIYSPTGTAGVNDYFEVTGVQLEATSTASFYAPNGATYQAELAACQRYYYRITPVALDRSAVGFVETTTTAELAISYPVTMRTPPTALEQSGTATDYSVRSAAGNTVCSAVAIFVTANVNYACLRLTVAAGLTVGNAALNRSVNTSAYFAWSAEL